MKKYFLILFTFSIGYSFSQNNTTNQTNEKAIEVIIIDSSSTIEVGPDWKENEASKIDEVVMFVDEDPVYEGLYQYIADSFNYPQYAIQNKIQGKIYLRFVVTSEGSVQNISIDKTMLSQPCPDCQKECLRIIHHMGTWKPGKLNGKNVSSWFVLPIAFSSEEN